MKGKVPAGQHTQCDATVRCSSLFQWSWAGCGLVPSTMQCRPHLFHNLLLPPQQGTTSVPIYTAWCAHGCEQLA